MLVIIKDERCEEILNLGFITAKDGDNYLHGSVNIYGKYVCFQDFMDGCVGKYRFRDDTTYTHNFEHNGCLFIGRGRGRKPESAINEMNNFIHKVANLKLILTHGRKERDEFGNDIYVFEI